MTVAAVEYEENAINLIAKISEGNWPHGIEQLPKDRTKRYFGVQFSAHIAVNE